MKNHQIINKLKVARDAKEIEALLGEAAMFEAASEKTRRRQQKVARIRLEQLEDGEQCK